MVYKPNKAIHPGQTILSILEREGMTQKNLGERTGLTEKHISQIINGEASITVETALLLENALGGSASFWINLEKNYQETKARLERVSLLKKEVNLLENFPYLELTKRGYVEPTTNKEKKVENLWKFFGVNSLLSIRETESVAFRKRDGVAIKSEAIATWLRCGELEAKKISLPEYSETTLKALLPKIKGITSKLSDNFSSELKKTFAEAGVALVYEAHFPKTGVSGAVRWINDVPVIQLSLFGSCVDIFLFNLFHEVGHLILHGKKEKFLEFDKKDMAVSQEKEKEADQFATDNWISKEKYNEFVQQGDFSNIKIIRFSQALGINPAILAGRLCHDNLVEWSKVAKLRTLLRFGK